MLLTCTTLEGDGRHVKRRSGVKLGYQGLRFNRVAVVCYAWFMVCCLFFMSDIQIKNMMMVVM